MNRLKRYEAFEQLKMDTKPADSKISSRREIELKSVFEEL